MDEYYILYDPDLDYELGKETGRDEAIDEVADLLKSLDSGEIDLPGFVWEVRALVDNR